jgi:hypothetical protein
MPTLKPRITITLSEHAHSVLSTLAQAQKVSMSSIVVDLVDTTLPVLERLSLILQNAAEAPQSVLDSLKKSLESAESEALGMQGAVMGNLDLFVALTESGKSEMSRDATKPEAPEHLGGAGRGRPPTSNRGVRNTSPTSKIDHISPMKKSEKHGRAEK